MSRDIDQLDWAGIAAQLDREGHAVLPGLFGAEDAQALAGVPRTPVASDLGGDVFLLAPGLPEALVRKFTALHQQLARIARRWNDILGMAQGEDDAGLAITLRLSRLREQDHQGLHRGAEDAHAFPLQLVALLSDPGTDFTGGEFVMVEQRPRMQSRPIVLPLKRGDVAIIPTGPRPFKGSEGHYRVTMKHAISRVRSGERFGLECLYGER